MKKEMAMLGAVVLGLSLAGCGNLSSQKENSSLKAENSSLKAAKENSSLRAENSNLKSNSEIKFSSEDYALSAYLKLVGQTPNDLKNNSDGMNWQQNGDTYSIDFGAHTTTMKVTKNKVIVTYDKSNDSGMGHQNGRKIYSKSELLKGFGQDKETLEQILSVKDNQNSSNTEVSKTQSSTHSQEQQSSQQPEEQSSQQQSSQDDRPDGVPANYKEYTSYTSDGHKMTQWNDAGHYEGDPDTQYQTYKMQTQAGY